MRRTRTPVPQYPTPLQLLRRERATGLSWYVRLADLEARIAEIRAERNAMHGRTPGHEAFEEPVSAPVLHAMESGRTRMPKPEIVRDYAQALSDLRAKIGLSPVTAQRVWAAIKRTPVLPLPPYQPRQHPPENPTQH